MNGTTKSILCRGILSFNFPVLNLSGRRNRSINKITNNKYAFAVGGNVLSFLLCAAFSTSQVAAMLNTNTHKDWWQFKFAISHTHSACCWHCFCCCSASVNTLYRLIDSIEFNYSALMESYIMNGDWRDMIATNFHRTIARIRCACFGSKN